MALLAIIVIIATAVCAATFSGGQTETEYLRIHVRANSNDRTDQAVKYKVKDEVVKYITPYAAQCEDKQTALKLIDSITDEIENVCDRVLRENGFSYGSKAELRQEEFPTRVYGDVTLEAGIYDALIIELGTGAGDNWWCVIYPPLCFTSSATNVEYRSAIYEILRKFFS